MRAQDMKGMRHATTPRRATSLGTLGRVALMAAVALGAPACQDLLLTDPAPGPVSVTFAARLPQGLSPAAVAEALQEADALTVRFVPLDEGEAFSETVPFSFQDGEGRARFQVDLEQESRRFRLEIRVLSGTDPLFAAVEESVELTQGAPTQVEPDLDPEVAEVRIEPVPTVTALGDEVTLHATALFATGTPIDDATFTFESLDPGVLSRIGGSSSNRFRADAEGTAQVRVVATAGAIEIDPAGNAATASVEVSAEAVELVASPTSLDVQVEETATVQVTARDANGNVLSRTIEFGSTNTSIATVSATGAGSAEVTGVSEGEAEIEATLGDLSVTIPVTVSQALGTGDVQVTLTWDNSADLDLWVTDPFGERIFFGNRTSQSGGQLDVDDRDGFGPENVFWPTGEAPSGTYLVQVDHFSGPAPANFEVRVLTTDGVTTHTGTVADGETLDVTSFVVGEASSCPVERTVGPGEALSGTLSSDDCTFAALPDGEVARAFRFVPGQERVLMHLLEGTVGVSLWRGTAGAGGRAGIAGDHWGATVLHLNPDGSYTLTIEGQPGAGFHLQIATATAHETDGAPDLIQWSEPVTGVDLAITSRDPVNSLEEHQDFHGIWPKPGEQWLVQASSDGTLRLNELNAEDQVGTTVGLVVDGNTNANGGRIFLVSSFENAGVPQAYQMNITQQSLSAAVKADRSPARPQPGSTVVPPGGR